MVRFGLALALVCGAIGICLILDLSLRLSFVVRWAWRWARPSCVALGPRDGSPPTGSSSLGVVGVVGVVLGLVVGVVGVVLGVVGVVLGVVDGVVGVVDGVVWVGVVDGAGAVVVAVGAGAAAGSLASDTETITPLTPGIWIWSSGVPGATSTVTVSCCPSWRVTSRVRVSAEADAVGRATSATRRATPNSRVSSLRLTMFKTVDLSPGVTRRGRRPVPARSKLARARDRRRRTTSRWIGGGNARSLPDLRCRGAKSCLRSSRCSGAAMRARHRVFNATARRWFRVSCDMTL
ncbi:MAG: hypothetical protein U0S48_22265 [Solirubrobacteraceae bacterium]